VSVRKLDRRDTHYRKFFFTTFVNTIFTTRVTPRFTAFLECRARIKAPLACGIAASAINRAATLIAY
jgi:ATP/ADP translocase